MLMKRKPSIGIIIYLLVVIILFLTVFPIIFTILNSLKSPQDIFQFPPPLLFKATLEPWKTVITGSDFPRYYRNSLIIAIITDLIVLITASMAGYALARFKIRKREDIAFWILSNSMMPPVAVIIPLYILFARIRLIDNFFGIILVFTALNLPFAVWLMRTFFEDIPAELEEAALVDGANRIQTFLRISIPVVNPGFISCGIYTFVMCINEFFFAFVLTGTRVKPAAVAMTNFLPTGVRGTMFAEAAVASILIMIPAILLFIFLQKQFIRGLTYGALKG
jgi:multiple sugar transport system permease protein